ncbi:MAG: DUF1631 family protein [Burkholderiaceae bacterium]
MPTALQRFIDDELLRSTAMIERALAGTLHLLHGAKDSARNASERAHHFALAEALQRQQEAYRHRFAEALHSAVRAALHPSAASMSSVPAAPRELALMDESVVEIDIEIARAAQQIDTVAEWQLRELQTFTSTLAGQVHVSAESNPFGPLVYAGSLWEAACVVSPAAVLRVTLLRISAGVVAGLLKTGWAAACRRLEAQGVEPGIYRTVLLAPGAATTRGADLDAPAPDALAGLLASLPGGTADIPLNLDATASTTQAPLSPELEQALARLDELLRHGADTPTNPRDAAATLMRRVNAQRAALLASVRVAARRRVVELLGRVFDTLLSDPQLPATFVAVLAPLQVSALRVALHDASTLESTAHPVWQLLNRIGTAGRVYPDPEDPRGQALLARCRQVAGDLTQTRAPDAALYRQSLERIDAFLVEQLQMQLRAVGPTVESLQHAERRELLEQGLSQRLGDQAVALRVSLSVRRFLAGPWAKVLAEAMLRFGDKAPATIGYVSLVDDLLWSVQLPDHPQSRQRLLTLLPDLLRRLRAGMALIRLPISEQQTVLDDLMAIHTEALRPGVRGGAAGDLSPAQIVQRLRDEVIPDAGDAPAFGDSLIDLASMETVPADLLPADPATGAGTSGAQVAALSLGACQRLLLHRRWMVVQLLWRSERGQFFLFAGESPQRPHSITRRALERLDAAGLMQPLEAHPLVERAVDALTRELELPA